MFDTGGIDLELDGLHDVLAISSANTIYAIEALFEDPYISPPSERVRRIIGNVGKPGLALLISPQNTMCREPELETWNLINHNPYDGVRMDSFKGTSLHLKLTGYEMPLNVGDHGTRDKQAFYLEAVISTYDGGLWVADINVLNLAHKQSLGSIPTGELLVDRVRLQCLPENCVHSSQEKAVLSEWSYITSVDN